MGSLLLVQDEDCSAKFSKNHRLNVIMTDFKGHWRSLILLLTIFGTVWTQVLNVQRCADPHCQGVISEGRTVLKYHANSNSMLSFGQSQHVKILSKGDGSQQDIWGVEINGKRGFANRRHLQETRVYQRNLGYIAPPDVGYYEVQLGGPEAGAQFQQPPPQQQQPNVPPPVQQPRQQPRQQPPPEQPPQQPPQGSPQDQQPPVSQDNQNPEPSVEETVKSRKLQSIENTVDHEPPVLQEQPLPDQKIEQPPVKQQQPPTVSAEAGEVNLNSEKLIQEDEKNVENDVTKPQETVEEQPPIVEKVQEPVAEVANQDLKPEVPSPLEQENILAPDDEIKKLVDENSNLDEMKEEEPTPNPELTQGKSTIPSPSPQISQQISQQNAQNFENSPTFN